jgi:hypothetical protein
MPHTDVESTTVLDLGDAYFKLLKGYSLREWLTDQRDLGHSYRTIAKRLEDVTDGTVKVSYRTVARWVNDVTAVAS